MAMKRCPICGEKFSDTYRDCPFCEEEDALRDGEEIRRKPHKGGTRVSNSRQFNIITPTLVILIIIMAALLVYLLYGDKLAEKFGNKKDNPSKAPIENVVEEQPDEGEPDEGTMPEESTEDPVDLPLATDYEVTMKLPNGINLSTNDFSLRAVGENHTIKVTGGGNGTYSWVSQDEGVASVDENGKVVAVSNGTVNVVVTDGQKKGVCIVRVRVSGSTTQTQTPAKQESETGGLKAGEAKVINAPNGVRVRSGPSTNHDVLATLSNGAKVKVVESAGDSWYSITFSGTGGKTTSGYMKADYLQNT